MKGVDVLLALFAAFMLVRHAPRALSLVRGEGPKTMAFVSLVNVVLAAVILVVAVKGILGRLISP